MLPVELDPVPVPVDVLPVDELPLLPFFPFMLELLEDELPVDVLPVELDPDPVPVDVLPVDVLP